MLISISIKHDGNPKQIRTHSIGLSLALSRSRYLFSKMGDPGLTAESLHDFAMSSGSGVLQRYADELLELGVTSRSLLRPGIQEQLVQSGVPPIPASDIVEAFREKFRRGTVGIFWDYEQVKMDQTQTTTLHAIGSVRNRLGIFGPIAAMNLYSPSGSLSDAHAVALQDAGAQIIVVPRIAKRGGMVAFADKPIIVDALCFAYQTKDPVVCIVSSDSDFAPLLSKLQMMGARAIMVTADNAAGRLVYGCATVTLSWPSSFLPYFMVQPTSQGRQALLVSAPMSRAPPSYAATMQQQGAGGGGGGGGGGGASSGGTPLLRQSQQQRQQSSPSLDRNAAGISIKPTTAVAAPLVVVEDGSPMPSISVESPSPKSLAKATAAAAAAATSSSSIASAADVASTSGYVQLGNSAAGGGGGSAAAAAHANPLAAFGIAFVPLLKSSSFDLVSPGSPPRTAQPTPAPSFDDSSIAPAPSSSSVDAGTTTATATANVHDVSDLDRLDAIVHQLHSLTGCGEVARAQVATGSSVAGADGGNASQMARSTPSQ